jgi:hypothetical protein
MIDLDTMKRVADLEAEVAEQNRMLRLIAQALRPIVRCVQATTLQAHMADMHILDAIVEGRKP